MRVYDGQARCDMCGRHTALGVTESGFGVKRTHVCISCVRKAAKMLTGYLESLFVDALELGKGGDDGSKKPDVQD